MLEELNTRDEQTVNLLNLMNEVDIELSMEDTKLDNQGELNHEIELLR